MKLVVLYNESAHTYKGVEIYKELFTVTQCRFEDKDIPKNAGFWWDATKKRWWTNNQEKASRLIQYADDQCKDVLTGAKKKKKETFVKSKTSTDTNLKIDIVSPADRNYFPYQKVGIEFGLERDSVLIADDMGLGKSGQALGIVDHSPTVKNTIIVCPASLKINWDREIAMWTKKPFITLIGFSNPGKEWDSFKEYQFDGIKFLIINYDILHKWKKEIDSVKWDCIIGDEIHYCKSGNSRRSKNMFSIKAKKKILLSGTPFLNKPIELFPILKYLDKTRWGNKHIYALKFCDPYHNGFGWCYSGAANLDKLQEELRSTVMIRRLKTDVLKELPPKRRQILEIPPDTSKTLLKQEQNIWLSHRDRIDMLMAEVEISKASDNPQDFSNAVEKLKEANKVAFTEMAKIRHDIAMSKVPFAVEHIQNIIEDGKTKVVVFAIHKDVVASIEQAFPGKCAVVTGSVSSKLKYIDGVETSDRQIEVDRFQKDPNCQIFVGNIHAAGVGLTLTAASHVLFIELDWVPGIMTQAEDRTHRISQVNPVLVQHIVLEGSLDSKIAKELVRKQDILDQSLDNETNGSLEELYIESSPATKKSAWVDIDKLSQKITSEDAVVVLQCLQLLASYTDKVWKDNAGFNSSDGKLGKNLANRKTLTPKQAALGALIAHKYRRQLDGVQQEVIVRILS